MRNLLLALLLLIQVSALGQSRFPVNMVGIWHEIPEYIMGWQDCYQFFPDSTFKHHFDPLNRSRIGNSSTFYHKGKWSIENDSLTLSVTGMKVIIDGEFQALSQDGVIIIQHSGYDSTLHLERPRVVKLYLKPILNFDGATESILMEGTKYWRVDKDPAKYNIE